MFNKILDNRNSVLYFEITNTFLFFMCIVTAKYFNIDVKTGKETATLNRDEKCSVLNQCQKIYLQQPLKILHQIQSTGNNYSIIQHICCFRDEKLKYYL